MNWKAEHGTGPAPRREKTYGGSKIEWAGDGFYIWKSWKGAWVKARDLAELETADRRGGQYEWKKIDEADLD